MSQLLTTEAVANLMANLFGKKVSTKKVLPFTAGEVNRGVVATYVRDNGVVGAVAVADLRLAANAGAALALVPAGYAQEMADGGQLPDNIRENFQEILNIGSRLFKSSRTPHVTLKDVWVKPAIFPAEVAALIGNPRTRLDVEISIPGYGEGRLSLLAR